TLCEWDCETGRCLGRSPARSEPIYSLTARRGKQLERWFLSEREQLRPDMLRYHGAEEGVGVGVVDRNRQRLADLAEVAVEDDDPVAHRAAHELDGVALFVAAFGGFAAAFDEDLDLSTEKTLVVLLADLVLDREQLVV